MKTIKRQLTAASAYILTVLTAALTIGTILGQQSSSPVSESNSTTAEDHQNMMAQLGIRKLRPGPSGNESAPNHANYDEATANPFPNLPDALTLTNGEKVTTPAVWWNQRRPQIVEDFEREVLGRVPRDVPAVKWTVTNTVQTMVGSYPVVAKQLIGHVDNSSYPSINVDIQMTLVIPVNATAPLPVMMMFGSGGLPQAAGPGSSAGADPPATQQLIADGWGYVSLNPGSI